MATVNQAHDNQDETFSLFFYGTLLHPAVLRRVIGHDGEGLYYQSAILFVCRSRIMSHSYSYIAI